jgi:hypothetical protein
MSMRILAIASVSFVLPLSVVSPSQAATCFHYSVNIQGNASSNFGTQQF